MIGYELYSVNVITCKQKNIRILDLGISLHLTVYFYVGLANMIKRVMFVISSHSPKTRALGLIGKSKFLEYVNVI